MQYLHNHRILLGSRMPKTQTKLSNLQTVSSILLVTSHSTMDRYCETCFENKDEKIDERCLCQDCNVFLCTPCYDIQKQTPSLLNHRIVRGTRMPKSQTKLSNIQTVTPILLVTSCNTMDSYCETSYDNNKDKKIDEICYCKDCNIFLSRPCHGVHKQVRSLQHHIILRIYTESQNLTGSRMPKSYTKLSNMQAITSILVVTIRLGLFRELF